MQASEVALSFVSAFFPPAWFERGVPFDRMSTCKEMVRHGKVMRWLEGDWEKKKKKQTMKMRRFVVSPLLFFSSSLQLTFETDLRTGRQGDKENARQIRPKHCALLVRRLRCSGSIRRKVVCF